MSTDPSFYWELNGAEREAAEPHLTANEGLLAHFINQGRRLIDLEFPPDVEYPDLLSATAPIMRRRRPESLDTYSAPIMAILQAASNDEICATAVCLDALEMMRDLYDYAADAAWLRHKVTEAEKPAGADLTGARGSSGAPS